MMKQLLIIGSCIMNMHIISSSHLSTVLKSQKYPFSYDLGLKLIASKNADAPVTICCHGYGSNNAIVDYVKSCNIIKDHLIGFNFPDYNCVAKQYDPVKSTFGTINEILPLLYLIKLCVIDGGLKSINLYGFSAGGGAIINALSVLNQSTCDEHLKKIGITAAYKKAIISALEHGLIILDCPLKSMEEIIEVHGKTKEFTIVAKHYAENNMRPIDAIHNLHGMKLNILVYFQIPDEVIGNRDDKLFIERLRHANKGATYVTSGNDGSHNAFHKNLWTEYKKIKNKE